MQPFDVPARLLLATLAWSSLVTAGTVQDGFVFPALPDRSDSLAVGRGYSISWRPELLESFPTYCPNCTVTKVDLWVGGATDGSTLAHKIASGLNINATQSYIWTCNLPDSELAVQTDWNFRFLPSGQTPDTTSQQISSPICLISDPSTATSTTTTSKITTTTTTPAATAMTTTGLSSAASTSPAAEATGSGTPGTGSSQSSGLSTGAAVGVGIGATVGVVALLGLGFVAFRRLTRRPQPGNLPGNPPDGGMGSPPKAPLYYDQHPPASAVDSYQMAPSWQTHSPEAQSWQTPSPVPPSWQTSSPAPAWQMPHPVGNAQFSELPGGNQHSVAELGGHR
ncbi:hypothetical protein GQ53DRAFT_743187 [Thozetella sp. PMI_491]|nr:hypothetical protein GQ53DRAFT_743187 [Thozetella sp. PMI_491]